MPKVNYLQPDETSGVAEAVWFLLRESERGWHRLECLSQRESEWRG